MKKLILACAAAAAFLCFQTVYAQAEFWKFTGTLQPVVTSWQVESPGGLSGTTLTISGLKNCSSLQTNGNGLVSCGSGGGGGASTGSVITIGDTRYVRKAGDTMTGTLVIDLTSGLIGLNVVEIASGAYLHAEKGLNTSGSLVWEGAGSGTSLTVSTRILSGYGTNSQPAYSFFNDPNTGVYRASADVLAFSAGGAQKLRINNTGNNEVEVTGGDLEVSGGRLYVSGGETRLYGGNVTIGENVAADTELEVVGAISGSLLFANTALRSSGSLVWEGAGSGSTLYVGGSLQGVGLEDCDLATQTLNWDATTGRFSCGTDADTNTTYTAGEGLDLTSTSFSLSDSISGTLLEFQTVSGSTVYGSKSVRSSGSLVWEGAGSGATLYLGGSLTGVGLTDCDADNQTLAWDATTGRFGCGDDDTGGASTPEVGTASFTGGVLVIGDSRYVQIAGDTMTGALIIYPTNGLSEDFKVSANDGDDAFQLFATDDGTELYIYDRITNTGLEFVTSPTGNYLDVFTQKNQGTQDLVRFGTGNVAGAQAYFTVNYNGDIGIGTDAPETDLEVIGAISGSLLFANTTLRSSGSLTWEGAASGATLYLGGSLQGVGLSDCDLSTQTLAWDVTTGRFSCGTDSDTTYTAGQGLTLNSTSFRLSDSISGSLLEFQTVSGSMLYASSAIRSSGSLVWEGTASGNILRGVGLTDCDTAGSSKLLWDTTTGQFLCGTDQTGAGGNWSGTGALQTAFDNRYVNTAGDTMTGKLLINLASGTDALEVVGTISGSTVQTDTLNVGPNSTISTYGTIADQDFSFTNFSGGGKLFNLYDDNSGGGSRIVSIQAGRDASNSNLFYIGTGSTITSSLAYFQVKPDGAVILNERGSATGDTRMESDTNANMFFLDASANRIGIGTGSPDTELEVIGTVSGSTIFGNNSLRSSGALVWEGAGSGQALNLAGGNFTMSRSGSTVFNENGNNVDIRMEGDANTGLFFLDASADRIGIGKANPKALFDVAGTISGSLVTQNGAGSNYIMGNLGVGMSSPAVKLDVQGTLRVLSNSSTTTALASIGRTAAELDIAVIGTAGTYSALASVGDVVMRNTTGDFIISAFNNNASAIRFSLGASDSEYMTLSGGKLGIGDSRPESRVQVTGGGLCVGSAANCNTDNNTEGIIYSSSTLMTTYDLAERYPTKDMTLGSGAILALDLENPVFVKRAEMGDKLIGIFSTKPAIDLGGFNGNQFVGERNIPVALAGRVPAEVTTENGPIAIGDEITISSIAGIGMKASRSDQSVGIALEPCSKSWTAALFRNHTCTIQIYVRTSR